MSPRPCIAPCSAAVQSECRGERESQEKSYSSGWLHDARARRRVDVPRPVPVRMYMRLSRRQVWFLIVTLYFVNQSPVYYRKDEMMAPSDPCGEVTRGDGDGGPLRDRDVRAP